LPPSKEVFPRPHKRYGRFDTYTKLGCAAIALTLKDAGVNECEEEFDGSGIVVSSFYEAMEIDKIYYETTIDDGGTLASPNLFSYTLPVAVLGECSALFKLMGPTFCVGESGGLGINALKSAAMVMAAGKTTRMLAGWIDSVPGGLPKDDGHIHSGAIFVLLDTKPDSASALRKLSYEKGDLLIDGQKRVNSLMEFFSKVEV
jgi:3-oxoacyl-(acyl-carrier-protein) synthase